MHHKILLIGLGPHSKRIYIRSLQQLGVHLTLIVELESKRLEVENFVRQLNPAPTLFFIPDNDRNDTVLSNNTQHALDYLIAKNHITHAIISTEPKAHYAYLQYLICRKIPTLTDKPITAPVDVGNEENQAKKISTEYRHLISLAAKHHTPVTVQCQRRYDLRYQWIAAQIKDLISKYPIPISHIQLNHCDGSWNMPNEFFSRENHPYKYGYGKIFHSGYHFIDLLAYLLSYDLLPPEKRPTDCLISSMQYGPNDQLFALDESFYKQSMGADRYASYYNRWKKGEYRDMGELDMLALFEFSHNSHVLTTCSLNLLQSGFSRRAWAHLPADTYKNNGRVRHESLNLQIGPLMNIQVHSYQAYEIKERHTPGINQEAAGGLEHFDIHIFRNSDIIGGPPHEIIHGRDLFFSGSIESFIGYNEHARDNCIADFLSGNNNKSSLQAQKLTVDLVSNLYVSMCRKRNGYAPTAQFKLTGQNFPVKKESSYDRAEFYCSLHCGS